MATTKAIFLVILSLVSYSLQSIDNNEIDLESTDPYQEVANDIRKEQDSLDIQSLFQNVLAKEAPNILKNIIAEKGGDILQGLASLASQTDSKTDSDTPSIMDSLGKIMNNLQGNEKKGGDGAASLLDGIGSLLNQGADQAGEGNQFASLLPLMGSLLGQGDKKDNQGGEGNQMAQMAALLPLMGSLLNQGGGSDKKENQGAALLQGLGSLLNAGGQGDGQGGLNPALIGSLVNMFADSGNPKNKEKEVPVKKVESRKLDNKPEMDTNFNMNDLLILASNMLGTGEQKGKNGQELNFLTFLPTILSTMNSFIGPDAADRAKSHEGHAWVMPPLLEKLHILFDHFIHSDLGKKTITALGAEKSIKVFLDQNGRFSYKKFGDMMENHSYRRQWIRIVTDKIATFLQYVSEPRVYKSYISAGQLFFNSYIKSQGFPKAAQFDPLRPIETISAFVNHLAKKYFDVKITSKEYVKPAVEYVQEALKLAEKSGTLKISDSSELSNKLADTINLEIIEPLARVNRAYRFILSVPKCERYVLCLVNQEDQNEGESLPGLKKLLYKSSSLLAGWFLSAHTGTPFWTLYTDVTQNTDCQKLYIDECSGFHAEELRVTTEYVHNEL